MVLLLCLKMGKKRYSPKGLHPELHEIRGLKNNQTRLKLFPPTKWKKALWYWIFPPTKWRNSGEIEIPYLL